MNRRNFLLVLTAIISSIGASFASEIVWLKEGGSVNYKNKSLKNDKCNDCKHFKDDLKTPDGGLCKSPAVVKGKTLYVKKEGHCSMFVRIKKA